MSHMGSAHARRVSFEPPLGRLPDGAEDEEDCMDEGTEVEEGKQQQARASGDRLAEPPPAWEQTSIGCSTEMLFGSATDAEGQSQPACAQLSLVRGVGRSVPALPPSFAPVLPTTVQPVTPGGKQIAHAMSQVLSPPMPQVPQCQRGVQLTSTWPVSVGLPSAQTSLVVAQTVQTAAPQPAELAQQTASIEALGLLGTHLIPPPTEPPNLQRVIDLTSPPTQPPPPMKSPKLQGDSVQMWGAATSSANLPLGFRTLR